MYGWWKHIARLGLVCWQKMGMAKSKVNALRMHDVCSVFFTAWAKWFVVCWLCWQGRVGLLCLDRKIWNAKTAGWFWESVWSSWFVMCWLLLLLHDRKWGFHFLFWCRFGKAIFLRKKMAKGVYQWISQVRFFLLVFCWLQLLLLSLIDRKIHHKSAALECQAWSMVLWDGVVANMYLLSTFQAARAWPPVGFGCTIRLQTVFQLTANHASPCCLLLLLF